MKTIICILIGCLFGWCAGIITFTFINYKSTPKSSSEGPRVSLTMDDVLVIYENGWTRGKKSGLLNSDTWAKDSAYITESLYGSFHEGHVIISKP